MVRQGIAVGQGIGAAGGRIVVSRGVGIMRCFPFLPCGCPGIMRVVAFHAVCIIYRDGSLGCGIFWEWT